MPNTMLRKPDGTHYMPGVVPNISRRGETSDERSEAMSSTYFDIDEADVRRIARAIADVVNEDAAVSAGRPKALLRRAYQLILKGTPEYQLPDQVRQELQNAADELKLSVSALAQLIRDIQAGVLREADPSLAPPPQARAVAHVQESLDWQRKYWNNRRRISTTRML